MIRLSATSLSSSEKIRDLDIHHRDCLFPDEQPIGVPLHFYSEYSLHTCLFECALSLAEKSEGCTPWYLPRRPNTTLCDPWRAAKFTKFLETTNPSQCTHCLPDCEATTYSTSTSSTPIRRCDSRNLNLNPFCDLDNTMDLKLAPWQQDVAKKYQDSGEVTVPSYVTNNTSEEQRSWFRYDEDKKLEMILKVKMFPNKQVLCQLHSNFA